MPLHLPKFEYSDLEEFGRALNALEDHATEVRDLMGGCYPDGSRPEPLIAAITNALAGVELERICLENAYGDLLKKAGAV